MNPDLLSAIVALVNSVMAGPLGATASVPKAYSEYAPPVAYPYAIVTNPAEEYEYQSPDEFGVSAMIADGQMQIAFYAPSQQQVRALGRLATRPYPAGLVDMDVPFTDGTLLEFRPMSAATTPLYEEGASSPTCYVRVVTFHYREQFPQQ